MGDFTLLVTAGYPGEGEEIQFLVEYHFDGISLGRLVSEGEHEGNRGGSWLSGRVGLHGAKKWKGRALGKKIIK